MLAVLGSDELQAVARPDAFMRPETKEILDGALYPWLLERTRQRSPKSRRRRVARCPRE